VAARPRICTALPSSATSQTRAAPACPHRDRDQREPDRNTGEIDPK